jgi:DNA-directed RNA polymerase subunit RPC12/RpoP
LLKSFLEIAQMPDIRFNCPRCSQKLVVDADGVGVAVPCPICGYSLVIPTKSSPHPVVLTGMFPENFRPREVHHHRKLAAIVRVSAKDLECDIENAAALLIARSSNGTPADALLRLRRVLEFDRSGTLAPVLTVEAAEKALKVLFPKNAPSKTAKH